MEKIPIKYKIALAGISSSFTHEAAELYCTAHELPSTAVKYIYNQDSLGAFAALHAKLATKAIMPIYNVTGGLVKMTIEAMGRFNFHVEEWFNLSVQQCLLIHPQAEVAQLTTVCSHEQGLKQCRQYLHQRWPNLTQKDYPDTALAAQALATGKLPITTAVIASRLAAKQYGLKILEEAIQDNKENNTTFIVVTL